MIASGPGSETAKLAQIMMLPPPYFPASLPVWSHPVWTLTSRKSSHSTGLWQTTQLLLIVCLYRSCFSEASADASYEEQTSNV